MERMMILEEFLLPSVSLELLHWLACQRILRKFACHFIFIASKVIFRKNATWVRPRTNPCKNSGETEKVCLVYKTKNFSKTLKALLLTCKKSPNFAVRESFHQVFLATAMPVCLCDRNSSQKKRQMVFLIWIYLPGVVCAYFTKQHPTFAFKIT